ncbi:MAG: tRNA glutamyl-Q(34) synthetase GluQRS [Alphaproteobacteria bacterium]|nr:tRNA glutamyl-Q(34) synthetase GluQRS [Alphaproteobacteria bacterium]
MGGTLQGHLAPVTRFAPSPTGLLHLGHAFSALFAAERAVASGGRFLLRIEDIDRARCQPEFTAAILADLAWLGLTWEAPVRRQSEHSTDYRQALATLQAMGVIYPCFCTRRSVAAEIAAAGGAPHLATDGSGPLYPGTCRHLVADQRAQRIAAGEGFALRLDVAAAAAQTGPLTWSDRRRGVQVCRPEAQGDVVLARKDTPTSYHLAVVVDDALQGVTLVTRAEDLLAATHVHRLLQALLGLPVPEWEHHPLLLAADGRRLAKRDQATTLASLRAVGHTAAAVRAMAQGDVHAA